MTIYFTAAEIYSVHAQINMSTLLHTKFFTVTDYRPGLMQCRNILHHGIIMALLCVCDYLYYAPANVGYP